MAESWAPAVDDVARHIPTRTRDTRNPGSDTLLGTFNSSTTPTADQAQAVIDSAVNGILSAVGDMPTSPAEAVQRCQGAARSAAEWRAAADIEIAYPVRDADVRLFAQLDQRAKDELATLKLAMQQENAGTVDVLPYWQMPDPPPWADQYLY